ncbi:hypothetical protein C4559_06055 [Candidatus Microgenomates bacterium]|nr:MAG: hypothetical protein C4559_06055 [Candidatus Microgenomates bacterium]
MKILEKLEKSIEFYYLLITSFIFFLLRLPSLFEPYWYGDEGIYQTIGIAMRAGRLLYRDIWDNKPPLLYFLYSIFNSDQFMLRLVSLIFGLLSVVAFFYLSKKLFNDTLGGKIPFFVTSLYAFLFSIPLIEGNIANSENFMLLPIILSGFIVYKITQTCHSRESRLNRDDSRIRFRPCQNDILLITSGILLSIAFLFKIVAIFDTAAFFIFLFIIGIKDLAILKDRKQLILSVLNLLPLAAGFIIPIFLTFVFFFLNGALKDFLSASFSQNVGYVGYGNQFLFPQGLLVLKLTILSLFLLFLLIKRKAISQSTLFILIWLAFSIFNAFFSQRPYIHYLLVLLPSFCLLFGLVFFDKRYQKLTFVISIIFCVIIFTSFKFYGKTVLYYQNFVSFVLGQKSVSSYQAFFDRQTPTDYQLAQFIKNHTTQKDNVFIWGNNAQVYKMANKLPAGKFTVAYHMTYSKKTLEETRDDINKQKPKYIIITSPRNPFPYHLLGYKVKLNIKNAIIYEKVF